MQVASTAPSRATILLFGLPLSGIATAARAIHTRGHALANDASCEGQEFGVSLELERLANGLIAPTEPRREHDARMLRGGATRDVDRQLDEAAIAIGRVLHADRTGPRVVSCGSMMALPSFWLAAFARSGNPALPLLVDRNPIALAQLTRAAAGPTLRRPVLAWYRATLAVLGADLVGTRVLASPALDLDAIGIGGTAAAPLHERRHPKDGVDLSSAPVAFGAAHELALLLTQWNDLDPPERARRIAALEAEAALVGPKASFVGPDPKMLLRNKPGVVRYPGFTPNRDTARTPLLFHYHIFKNAGTSVDKMLKANFGERWAEQEFSDGPLPDRHAAIRTYLKARPNLQALSSHTAPLPVPELPDREIFPVLFVRHPLLRVRSAYEFEKKQVAETRGAMLAKTTDLKGYVTTLLDDPSARHLRNFQALRFSKGTPGRPAQERERALKTLAKLPFVGLVEAYEQSVDRLGELIRPIFPDFKAIALRENVTATSDSGSLNDKLDALRGQLGESLYNRLLAENVIDLDIYTRVRANYLLID